MTKKDDLELFDLFEFIDSKTITPKVTHSRLGYLCDGCGYWCHASKIVEHDGGLFCPDCVPKNMPSTLGPEDMGPDNLPGEDDENK